MAQHTRRIKITEHVLNDNLSPGPSQTTKMLPKAPRGYQRGTHLKGFPIILKAMVDMLKQMLHQSGTTIFKLGAGLQRREEPYERHFENNT